MDIDVASIDEALTTTRAVRMRLDLERDVAQHLACPERHGDRLEAERGAHGVNTCR